VFCSLVDSNSEDAGVVRSSGGDGSVSYTDSMPTQPMSQIIVTGAISAFQTANMVCSWTTYWGLASPPISARVSGILGVQVQAIDSSFFSPA
jgi:hypothetical protein